MDTVKTEIEFDILIDICSSEPEIIGVYKKGEEITDLFTEEELKQMLKDCKEQA